MARPGLLFVKSNIVKKDEMPPARWVQWYEKVHIPDVLATSGIAIAYRYTNVDPDASHQFLAIYPVQDVEFFKTDEFTNIPSKSKKFFGDHGAQDFADFELRTYEHLQLFETEKTKEGRAPYMTIAAIEPKLGGDDDLEDWYRCQHLDMLSMVPGYRRGTRYKLLSSMRDGTPRYLALHEFESAELPADEIECTTKTEWSKNILGSALQFERELWKLENQFGNIWPA